MCLTDSSANDAQALDPSNILTGATVRHHFELNYFLCLALVFALALNSATGHLLLHLLV